MAEPILLHVAEKLLDKLASFVVEEVSLAWGLKDDLLKLQKTLVAISAVIADAEKRQSQEHKLRLWLEDLKDVLYDSENALDEFECEELRKQVTERGKFGGKVLHFFSCSNPIAFRFKMGHRIKEIRNRLYEITAMKDAFNLNQQLISGGVSHRVWRETHSHVSLPEIIGREIDRDAIVERLLCQDIVKNPFIVSIIGIGGLGKTTLAKLVYNDNRVEDHFEKRIWVCVSDDFNLKQILQKIVNHQNPSTVPSIHNVDVEQLQANMRDLLEGKKFLLVLDDVWNENRRHWSELSDLLTCGNRGSSIIVTTRSSKVASMVGTRYEHKLEGLSHDSCMTLFKKPYEDGLSRLINPEILEIGSQIVEKCGGVPLVVKALGGLLSSNVDVKYWRSIMGKNIFTVLQNEDDILPIIKLSYDHLPPHLKRCFHFCSLFPKDFQFDNIVLGRYWKSVGLIDMLTGVQNPEEVAEQYMKELLARSFFQDFEEYGAVFTLKMHDLVHDLAISVARNECSAVNFDTPCIPRQVQHILIKADTFNNDEKPLPVPPLLNKANSCRTFMLRYAESGISKELVKACISSSKFIRLLDLEGSNFEVMPSSIGTLKHLRHLNLEHNRKIRRLPSSICNLQSLQALWLDGCESLEELPKCMWKLINLEQLSLTTQQKSLKSTGIGYLKSLKYLWICECNNLECLFEGVDVRGLTALRVLSIRRCQSLTSIPVNKFKFLTSLEVVDFIDCRKLDISMDEELFPVTFRTLSLYRLPLMSSLPEWLLGSADTLESLQISNCPLVGELPAWLKNLRHLRRLQIFNCSRLVSLPDGVQSLTALKQLQICGCGELNERCQPNGPDWCKIAHIPKIEIDLERIDM